MQNPRERRLGYTPELQGGPRPWRGPLTLLAMAALIVALYLAAPGFVAWVLANIFGL